MSQTIQEVEHGQNYTVAQVGEWGKLDQYSLTHESLPEPLHGKLFLSEALKLTGIEVSLNKVPPGKGEKDTHYHTLTEELYIFQQGKGQIQVDGNIIDVKEGSIVRIAPNGYHALRNNGEEDLYFIVIRSINNSYKNVFPNGLLSLGEGKDGGHTGQVPEWTKKD
jgi:mannose-6-phosphate isomerase-like protein (cupin superfamily)